jgi:hypothetical protein
MNADFKFAGAGRLSQQGSSRSTGLNDSKGDQPGQSIRVQLRKCAAEDLNDVRAIHPGAKHRHRLVRP